MNSKCTVWVAVVVVLLAASVAVADDTGRIEGRITVESEIEKGTTFTVFIPREAPEGVDEIESEPRGDRS